MNNPDEIRDYKRITRLMRGSDLELGVNRWTVLVIWLSEGKLYMRLDRASQYYVPLKRSTARYVKGERTKPEKLKVVQDLCRYQFGRHIDQQDLERVIEIVSVLPNQERTIW